MEGCGSTHLDSLQVVAVVAQDPGQLDAPDLGELLQGEGGGPAAVLVPESVPVAEVVELLADQTGEGRPHHAARQRPLRDAGGPQVNVLGRGEDLAESLHVARGYEVTTTRDHVAVGLTFTL